MIAAGDRQAVPADARADAAIPVLAARDLSVQFASRGSRGRAARAVDGVNLDIGLGEIVALVGESGCGKTTLARTMLGLERPTRGQVLYQGKPLSYRGSALRAYRRAVQLVLQDPTGSLNPRHTVYEAIAEGVRVHKLDNELGRVSGALARCGLRPPERFFQRYPHELSGGQRQRVVIAGALVLDPSVLIADEPVASLDASVRGEILLLLLQLRAGLGLAALVVTHDLGLAWNIADRLAVMYLGRIVEVGTPEQVFSDPRHPYTKALMSVLPESPSEPIVLTGEPPDPAAIPPGCRFHPRCQELASGAAAAAGVDADCTGTALPVLPASAGTGADGTLRPLVACHLAWAAAAAGPPSPAAAAGPPSPAAAARLDPAG
jgi:oligopeptide/dipeptide ABC transporter ATP-binding protein